MRKFTHLLEKTLSSYTPEDGEYIDLVAFNKVFPTIKPTFWMSCILGCGVGGRSVAVKRLPLLGRIIKGGKWRVVVLISSLKPWLEHYNPDKERAVEVVLADLIRATKRHENYLNYLRVDAKIKRGPRKKSEGQQDLSIKSPSLSLSAELSRLEAVWR